MCVCVCMCVRVCVCMCVCVCVCDKIYLYFNSLTTTELSFRKRLLKESKEGGEGNNTNKADNKSGKSKKETKKRDSLKPRPVSEDATPNLHTNIVMHHNQIMNSPPLSRNINFSFSPNIASFNPGMLMDNPFHSPFLNFFSPTNMYSNNQDYFAIQSVPRGIVMGDEYSYGSFKECIQQEQQDNKRKGFVEVNDENVRPNKKRGLETPTDKLDPLLGGKYEMDDSLFKEELFKEDLLFSPPLNEEKR